jgi:hypothetical protein
MDPHAGRRVAIQQLGAELAHAARGACVPTSCAPGAVSRQDHIKTKEKVCVGMHGQRTQPVVDGRTQLRRASKSAVGFAAPAVRTGICFRKAPVAACSAQTQSQHQQHALAFASGKHQSRHAVRRRSRSTAIHQQHALAFASGKHQSRHAVRRGSRSTGGTRCSAPAGFLLAPGGSSRRMRLSFSAEFSLISTDDRLLQLRRW